MKNIYFGEEIRNAVTDVTKTMYSVTSNGSELQIPSPDMSESSGGLKLDILYYNTVNRHGEVLSSIVYISDIRDSTEADEITYAPATLLNRSDLEQSMTVTGDSKVWLNANIIEGAKKLINNQTRNPVNSFSRFSAEVDYAATPYDDRYMYDGWYSILTVAPTDIPNTATVPAGTLRNRSGVIEYAIVDNPTTGAQWTSITNIDATVPISNIIRNTVSYNPYLRRDFFVIHRLNAMYSGTIGATIDREWFSGLKFIRPKIRGISISAETGDFSTCQHIINSVDIALINQII